MIETEETHFCKPEFDKCSVSEVEMLKSQNLSGFGNPETFKGKLAKECTSLNQFEDMTVFFDQHSLQQKCLKNSQSDYYLMQLNQNQQNTKNQDHKQPGIGLAFSGTKRNTTIHDQNDPEKTGEGKFGKITTGVFNNSNYMEILNQFSELQQRQKVLRSETQQDLERLRQPPTSADDRASSVVKGLDIGDSGLNLKILTNCLMKTCIHSNDKILNKENNSVDEDTLNFSSRNYIIDAAEIPYQEKYTLIDDCDKNFENYQQNTTYETTMTNISTNNFLDIKKPREYHHKVLSDFHGNHSCLYHKQLMQIDA